MAEPIGNFPGLTAAGIKRQARDLGFDACGVCAAVTYPKLGRLRSWIAEGRAGDMAYLEDSLDERSDPTVFLPTARSVVSLAVVYHTPHPLSVHRTAPGEVSVARYAWGDDYHDVLRPRLRALVTWMASVAGPGLEALTCVDDGPVQERVFAEQAGIGWIGKNTCVISPQMGSWLFLGEVVTNASLEPDTPAVDQCGSCTRCLDACPTGAIIQPYTVDATRCLSYLTIETRKPVASDLRPFIEQQVFGCDICQDVCPWNRRAAVSVEPSWQPRDGLSSPSLLAFCALSDDAWRARLRGSAMRRAGLRRLRRSMALAAAHLPVGDAAVALATLAAHPSAEDPAVADALTWSRTQIEKQGSLEE